MVVARRCSDLGASDGLLVLTQRLEGLVDGLLERAFVLQVLADLLDLVRVEDHTDDATGAAFIDGCHLDVKVLTQELLLGVQVALAGEHLRCDGQLLLSRGNRHGHGHRLWDRLAAESREAGLVDRDALLLSLLVASLLLLALVAVLLVVVLTVLLVLSLKRSKRRREA